MISVLSCVVESKSSMEFSARLGSNDAIGSSAYTIEGFSINSLAIATLCFLHRTDRKSFYHNILLDEHKTMPEELSFFLVVTNENKQI